MQKSYQHTSKSTPDTANGRMQDSELMQADNPIVSMRAYPQARRRAEQEGQQRGRKP